MQQIVKGISKDKMSGISTPKTSRRRCGASARTRHFPPGTRIEVETREGDLYGVYFSATVVPPPPSGSKKSRLLHVEYDDLLVSEEGTDRLKEHVDISVVRPEPPFSQKVVAHCFVPNDFVDAFYMDGWWSGVVRRVVEGGERFVVAFEKPPDEHEFGLSQLRAHWDWVDGVWAWPHKAIEAVFVVGMKVEFDFEGAWFPAEIVESLENGDFLVEWIDKDGECIQNTVDSLHVRPSPPIVKAAKFGESEKVEALLNCGWFSGVITEVLEKNGYYIVHLDQYDHLFDRSELRPLMEWKDGKWLIVSAPVDAIMNNSPLSIAYNSLKSKSAKKRSKSADSKGAMKKKKHANPENEVTTTGEANLIEEKDAMKKKDNGEIESDVTTPEKLLEIDYAAGEVGRMEEMGAKQNGEMEGADQESDVATPEKLLEIGHAAGEVGRMEEMGAKQNGEMDGADQESDVTPPEKLLEIDDAAGEVGRMEEMGAKQNGVIVGAGQESDVATPEKLLEIDHAAGEVGRMEEMGAKQNGEMEGAGQESDVATPEKLLEIDHAAGEVGRMEEMGAKQNGEMEGADQESDVTPPEKLLEIDNAAGEIGRMEEMGEKILEEITNNNPPPVDVPDLPFVKENAAVWKAIESNEIFQKLPQRPHFEPLQQMHECVREGEALRCMLTFTNVADRCYSVKIDDQKCKLDAINGILLDLKGHGFNVAVLQHSIMNLLEMKEREEKLVQEMKDFENQSSEHGEKRSKIHREIEVTKEHVRKLQEKLLIDETAEAKEVDEIARAEAGRKEREEQIKSVRSDMQGEVVRLQTREPEPSAQLQL